MTWRTLFGRRDAKEDDLPRAAPDMGEVMRRVDEQIGRALTRLSER